MIQALSGARDRLPRSRWVCQRPAARLECPVTQSLTVERKVLLAIRRTASPTATACQEPSFHQGSADPKNKTKLQHGLNGPKLRAYKPQGGRTRAFDQKEWSPPLLQRDHCEIRIKQPFQPLPSFLNLPQDPSKSDEPRCKKRLQLIPTPPIQSPRSRLHGQDRSVQVPTSKKASPKHPPASRTNEVQKGLRRNRVPTSLRKNGIQAFTKRASMDEG